MANLVWLILGLFYIFEHFLVQNIGATFNISFFEALGLKFFVLEQIKHLTKIYLIISTEKYGLGHNSRLSILVWQLLSSWIYAFTYS